MLSTIGADLHADPDFGLAAVYTAPGAAPIATTARAVRATAAVTAGRGGRRDNLTADLYLLVSAVADRPPHGALVEITAAGSPYLGAWRLMAAAEPTSAGEWRCPARRETVQATMAAAAGFPRPRVEG